jgi:hypothetical protein
VSLVAFTARREGKVHFLLYIVWGTMQVANCVGQEAVLVVELERSILYFGQYTWYIVGCEL